METLDRGILASGCTKTVSRELWMNEYLSALPEKWVKIVKTINNTTSVYRFGDGNE